MNPAVPQISPNFTSDSFGHTPNIETKILIFYDREIGWRFRIAELAEPIPNVGYAMISILFAYFEMVAQYSSGTSSERDSKAFFRKGVRFVYPTTPFTDPELNEIYSRIRCGMYHNGYTKFGALISGGFPHALAFEDNTVKVNPHKLRINLQAHLISYVATLNDVTKTDERAKFEAIFDAGTH